MYIDVYRRGGPVCGSASPAPGVPQYEKVGAHILGYPTRWECIPAHWVAPLCVDMYRGTPPMMGVYPHMGHPPTGGPPPKKSLTSIY